MKKLLSLVLALMMVLGLTVPALAAGEGGTAEPAPTYTITINNPDTGHTYDAYQIFDGDLYNGILSNIKWGSGVNDGAALLAALKADTFEFTMNYKDSTGNAQTKTTTLAVELANAADAEDVAVFLTGLSDDSFGLDRFAEILGEVTVTENAGQKSYTHKYLTATPNASVNTQTNGAYVFNGLDAGYYLIKDRDGTQDGQYDFYTKYILCVTANQTVNVKGNTVTVDKKIGTDLAGDFTDWKDFDINDTAYYRLVASTPDNYNSYHKYEYKFTDTLPKGITFNRVEKIYVRNKTNHATVLTTLYTAPATGAPTGTATLLTLPASGTPTASVTQTIGTPTADKPQQVVQFHFEDMKILVPNMTSNYELVVEYSADITKDVLISEYGSVVPNTNEVILEYSNNPSGEGLGKTVKDISHAFTFTIKLNKLVKNADKADVTAKLAGAEFVMYYIQANTDGSTTNMYAQFTEDENGKKILSGYTSDRTQAGKFVTDANGNAALYGVDSGDYWLEEIKAPSGYNLLDAPVKFSIAANIVLNTDGTVNTISSTVAISVDGHTATDGTAYIENSQGSTLPETGGMGTTLFYIVGSIMVLGAAVMLITKKRMAA